MASEFDAFVKSAWAEHADQTDAVARRLAASTHLVQQASQVAPYAALLVHVYGVHLAQWSRGTELLASLRAAPGHDGSAAAEGPVRRGIAALGLASGDAHAADALPAPDRVAAWAQASSALLDREDIDRAAGLFDHAIELAAGAALSADAPAVRALAVGGNNLAATLEDRPSRTPAQTAAMLRAAEAGLEYWTRCGSWLERERAEYRLARSLWRAGQAGAALQHARSCLRICVEHDAPAFERFFGHVMEALALVACGDGPAAQGARAKALQAYDEVPTDERAWCADDLKQLDAVGSLAT